DEPFAAMSPPSEGSGAQPRRTSAAKRAYRMHARQQQAAVHRAGRPTLLAMRHAIRKGVRICPQNWRKSRSLLLSRRLGGTAELTGIWTPCRKLARGPTAWCHLKRNDGGVARFDRTKEDTDASEVSRSRDRSLLGK